jgi:hypothetical protein
VNSADAPGRMPGEIRQTLSVMVLLGLSAFCITLPLFLSQSLPDTYDIIVHYFQADRFSRVLHEGALYPRWVADSNNGYGEPNFVFYAPLSYAFVAALRCFFLPLQAFIVALWFSFFLSGLTMFTAAGRIMGKAGGLAAAFFYQIMPFHLFDLYERGGFAELFAFVWFPLIIYFLFYLKKNGGRSALLGLSLSYAGLVMTHLVSAFIFSFIIGLWLIFGFMTGEKRSNLASTIPALLLGLGLSSVYLMPAAFEQKFVHIDYITKCIVGDYRKNFLTLLDMPQLHGFQLWMRIYTIMEVLLFLVIMLILAGRRTGASGVKEKNFFVLFFIISLFFTLTPSGPLWAAVPGLATIQFPWRWLTMVEVALAFLIGAVFSTGEKPDIRSPDRKKRMTIYLLLVFAVAALKIILGVTILPSSYNNRVISLREYTPIWVTDRKTVMSQVSPEKVTAVGGTASFHVMSWKSEERKISADAAAPVTLRIATFYFPGWEAGLDRGTIPIRVEPGSGAMLLDLPAGRHEVVLRFGDTPLRRYAAVISFISLFMLAAIVTLYGRKRRTFSLGNFRRKEKGNE